MGVRQQDGNELSPDCLRNRGKRVEWSVGKVTGRAGLSHLPSSVHVLVFSIIFTAEVDCKTGTENMLAFCCVCGFFFFFNSNCLLSFGLKEEGVLYLLRSGMFEPVHMTVLLQPERVKLLLNLGVLVSGALNCSFCFFKYCRGILNRTTRFYLFFFLFFHLTLNINP